MSLSMVSHGAAKADPVLDMRAGLESKLRAAHAGQDCKAMTKLFYTRGMGRERKKLFSKTIESYLCGNFGRPIESMAFQDVESTEQKIPSDFNGKASAFTLKPEGAMVIDYGKGKKPEDPKALSFLYGTHDGQAYLITTKNADTK